MAQSSDDMRRFQGAGGTSRAAGSTNSLHIQRGQQSNAIRSVHHERHGIGQTTGSWTDQMATRDGFNAMNQTIHQGFDGRFGKNGGNDKFSHGGDHPGTASEVFGAG